MIEANNLTNRKIDIDFLKKVAKKVLVGENGGSEDLSIALVDGQEMVKLNKEYRKKNKPTDVLSFGKVGESLAEVVICPEFVGEKKEMVRVLIHGILHLLGYDHEKSKKAALKMTEREDCYLKAFKF